MNVDPLTDLPGADRASALVQGLDHPEGVAHDRASGLAICASSDAEPSAP